MSAILDALSAGLEKLAGNRDILCEMRLALDALHDCSHEHEDWLNRSRRVRVAANRLEKAVAKLTPAAPDSAESRRITGYAGCDGAHSGETTLTDSPSG